MVDIIVGVKVRTTGIVNAVPNVVTGVALSPNKVPNPGPTSFRVGWTPGTIPVGGTQITQYYVYLDGAHARTVNALDSVGVPLAVLEAGFGPSDGILAGSTHLVAVSAVNSYGEGALSSVFSVTTIGTTAPPPPLSVTLGTVTSSSVALSWLPVTYVNGTCLYKIYNASTNALLLTTAPGANTGTVTGLTAATNYTFYVKSVDPLNSANLSSASNTVSALTGTTTSGGVTPMSADAVVQTFGINWHSNFSGTYGADQTQAFRHAAIDHMVAMGVRRIRDHIPTTGDTDYIELQTYFCAQAGSQARLLLEVGADSSYGTTLTTAQNRVNPYLNGIQSGGAAYVALIEGLEGVNEPNNDGAGTTNTWVSKTRNMQQALAEQARARTTGTTALSSIPIVAPGLANRLYSYTVGGTTYPGTYPQVWYDDYAMLGDINAWADIGNTHIYASGVSPGGKIATICDAAKQSVSSTKPMWTTEMGYQDTLGLTTNKQAVPDDVHAVYGPRLLMEHVYAGHTGAFLYEALDDVNPANDSIQANYGLIETPSLTQSTWTRKLHWYAYKRFFSLMADPGGTFTLNPFQITVAGGGSNFKWRLCQKRNGKYYLVMWRDVTIYDPAKRTYSTISPASVTVTLPSAMPVALHTPSTQSDPKALVSTPYRTLNSGSFGTTVAGDLVVAVIG